MSGQKEKYTKSNKIEGGEGVRVKQELREANRCPGTRGGAVG